MLFCVIFSISLLFADQQQNDQAACTYARKNNNAEIWKDYLKQFPNGICAFEAKSEIKKLNHKAQRKAVSLHWSKKAKKMMVVKDAVNYCKNLSEGGHKDWRLPTIDELRTLIQNCPNTETDGACNVTDSCLSQNECKNRACNGCENKNIRHSKLGDRGMFWSSSFRPDNNAWYIDFTYGSIHSRSNEKKSVRCVR